MGITRLKHLSYAAGITFLSDLGREILMLKTEVPVQFEFWDSFGWRQFMANLMSESEFVF